MPGLGAFNLSMQLLQGADSVGDVLHHLTDVVFCVQTLPGNLPPQEISVCCPRTAIAAPKLEIRVMANGGLSASASQFLQELPPFFLQSQGLLFPETFAMLLLHSFCAVIPQIYPARQ